MARRSIIIGLDRYILNTSFNKIRCKKVLVKKNQVYNYKKYISGIKYKITREKNIYKKYKSNNNDLKKEKEKSKFLNI